MLLLVIVACTSEKPGKKEKPVQEYINVDARVRKYLSDGRRIYEDYQPFQTRTVENLAGYSAPEKLPGTSRYGGRLDKREEATGFFHVKKIGDRWWGIDPEGYRYVNMALNSISRGKSERNEQALKDKFGTPENWMKETVKMLHENGFNCAGSWSDHKAVI